MKIQQETPPYRPIIIKLEDRAEAVAMLGIVDKLENFRCNENQTIRLSDDEIAMLVELSDVFGTLNIPKHL